MNHKNVKDLIDFTSDLLSHSPTVYSERPIYIATNSPMTLAKYILRRNIIQVAIQSPKYVAYLATSMCRDLCQVLFSKIKMLNVNISLDNKNIITFKYCDKY